MEAPMSQHHEEMAFHDAMSAQKLFNDNFDLNNPSQAAAAYARMMHEHTERQMRIATRRSSAGAGAVPEIPRSTASLVSQSSRDSSSSGQSM